MLPDPSSAARRDPASLILALVLVLIGGYVLVATASMSAMGAVFPRTIAVVMIVTAVLLAAVKLYRPSARSGAGEEGGSPLRRLALVGVVLAWAVLFPYVGFVVTGLVAFFLVCLIAEHDCLTVRHLLLFAAVDLVLVVGSWLLLASALNVPFPRGVLF